MAKFKHTSSTVSKAVITVEYYGDTSQDNVSFKF